MRIEGTTHGWVMYDHRNRVRYSYASNVQDRIHALRENRVRSNHSLTSEERIALIYQRARFAALLAKLPTPKLP